MPNLSSNKIRMHFKNEEWKAQNFSANNARCKKTQAKIIYFLLEILLLEIIYLIY